MAIPRHCVEAGEIAGLLVCTQCTEDSLAATVNTGGTLELVGTGGRR
jgi:hypothetical protein